MVIPIWYHHCVAFTVRTDPTLEAALTALAESESISRQEVIRRAVMERFERAGHRAAVSDSCRVSHPSDR